MPSRSWDTAVLDRFSAVFGPEAVKIVSYSHLEDNGIDIARHFLATFVDPGDFALPAMGVRTDRSPPRTSN